MPACFTLTRKGKTQPMKLGAIDDFICKSLNEDPDPVQWCHNWVNTLGFSIAVGHSFAQMRHIWGHNESLIEIIDILEEHFTSGFWTQRH